METLELTFDLWEPPDPGRQPREVASQVNYLWLRTPATLCPCPHSALQGLKLRPPTGSKAPSGMRVKGHGLQVTGAQLALGHVPLQPSSPSCLPFTLSSALLAGFPEGLP